MGSVIRFRRHRQPSILLPKRTDDRETRDAIRTLYVFIACFFVTAVVLCGAVVISVSATWTDVLVVSAFVFVFALVKIVFADALMLVMMRADQNTPEPSRVRVPLTFRRPVSPRVARAQAPVHDRRTRMLNPDAIRLVSPARTPHPPMPGGR